MPAGSEQTPPEFQEKTNTTFIHYFCLLTEIRASWRTHAFIFRCRGAFWMLINSPERQL